VESRARTEQEWARLIDRISRFNPFFLTGMHAESVRFYLAGTKLVEPAPRAGADADRERRALYETRCGTCHTLDVILAPTLNDADWPALLRRMDAKAPGLAAGRPSAELADWIRNARANPDRFRAEAPHQSRSIFLGDPRR